MRILLDACISGRAWPSTPTAQRGHLWSADGLRASEDGTVVEAREHKPTLERAQETRLGHRGDVLGIRQVHVGVFDSVDHTPVSGQGTTSELAHVHGNYDGQACFDRSLDFLPYFLACLSFVRRSSPASIEAGKPKRFYELAGRSAEQSEQMIRG